MLIRNGKMSSLVLFTQTCKINFGSLLSVKLKIRKEIRYANLFRELNYLSYKLSLPKNQGSKMYAVLMLFVISMGCRKLIFLFGILHEKPKKRRLSHDS